MRCGHEQARTEQEQHLALAQHFDDGTGDLLRVPFHLGQGQRAEQRSEQQGPAHPELRTDRREVEQQADAHHRHDEADRTPEADAAVALGVGRQMAERQRLDQGQGGAPEKMQDGHAE